MTGAAIAGIGRTDFSRHSGRTTQAMAVEAVQRATADAGLTAADIDGMVCFGLNDTAPVRSVVYAAGMENVRWTLDIFGGGNAVVTAVHAAAMAVTTGTCRAVGVYRSLNGRSGRRFGQPGDSAAEGEAQFQEPHGYGVPPQFMAMWARRHQHEYGTTCDDLGAIAVTHRSHAQANPHAIAREPLTLEQYRVGRWINEPLRVYDCAYEVDGACALVVTSLQTARALGHPPVLVAPGIAEWVGSGGSWEQWPDFTEMFSARVAPRLWDSSGFSPADVDIACVYDCFTYTVMVVLEDFGFAPKGRVGHRFREGRFTYGGDVVVNPHGGLLSEGYLHGLNHHVEAVLQLRGEAGSRQVEDAEVALVTGGAGPFGGAVIYTADR